MYPSTLFVAPKLGGILQSSGFLDLRCLMSLSQTCKAHVFDELSLILVIENEITRHSQVSTLEEAIRFLRNVYQKPLLKRWLERDYYCAAASATATGAPTVVVEDEFPTTQMMYKALAFDVMFVKMLHMLPRERQLQEVVRDRSRRTMLHRAGEEGNMEAIVAILSLIPESDRLPVMLLTENTIGRDPRHLSGMTVLHDFVFSGRPVRNILELLPESQRLAAVEQTTNLGGDTVLHLAAGAGNVEAIRDILALYPESQRFRAVCERTSFGKTVMHYATESEHAVHAVGAILYLLPESQRWQAVNVQDEEGKTIFDLVVSDDNSRRSLMELLPSKSNSQDT